MGKMDLHPVNSIEDDFLENILMKVEGMDNDAEACLEMFRSWKRRNEDEADATLKQRVEVDVNKMKDDFQIYKQDLAAKERNF